MGTRVDDCTVATASDVDAQREMEHAECILATIMDERAAMDAMALVLDTCAAPVATTQPVQNDSDSDNDDREAHNDDANSDAPLASPVDSLISDSNNSDCSDEATPRRTPVPLVLELLASSDQPVQWDLISPWSESEQTDDNDDDSTDAAFFGADTSERLYTISEPEPETETVESNDDDDDDDDDAGSRLIEAQLRALIKAESDVPIAYDDTDDDGGARTWPIVSGDVYGDGDDDDDEFDVYNRSVATADSDGSTPEFVDEPLESSSSDLNDDVGTAAADCLRTSIATTLDESCDESPRVSTVAAAASRLLGRRAQTYSGAASASVQSAFAKLRSRTLSTTTTADPNSQRQSSQCSSTTASEAEDWSTSTGGAEYESDRNGSFSSDARHSSYVNSKYVNSDRPTLAARLGRVGSMRMAGKMGGLLRFRSSSATTTASDESYCTDGSGSGNGVSHGEAQSAPSLSAALDAANANAHQQRHTQLQMQALKLRASAAATKAAVYINAASTEAARKLKSRTMRKAGPSNSSDENDVEHTSVSVVDSSSSGA